MGLIVIFQASFPAILKQEVQEEAQLCIFKDYILLILSPARGLWGLVDAESFLHVGTGSHCAAYDPQQDMPA